MILDDEFQGCDKLFEEVDLSRWERVYKDECIVLYRSRPEDSTLYHYRIEGRLEYSAATFFDVNCDLEYRKEWDGYAKELHVIETCPNITHADVVYWCVRFPFPLANRDYVYHRRVAYLDESKSFIIVSRAGKHETTPEKKNTVRVDQYFSKMVIRPIDPTSCDFRVVYHDDLKGNIPSAIVNWAVGTGIPSMIQKLQKACESYLNYQKQKGTDLVVFSRRISVQERPSIVNQPSPVIRAIKRRRRKRFFSRKPDMQVEIQAEEVGIVFYSDPVTKRFTVNDQSHPVVEPGMELTYVDKTKARGLSMVELQALFQKQPRPMILSFKYGKKKGRIVMKVRPGCPIHRYIRPLAGEKGAITSHRFAADPLENEMVEKDYIVAQINAIDVLEMKYDAIVQLLMDTCEENCSIVLHKHKSPRKSRLSFRKKSIPLEPIESFDQVDSSELLKDYSKVKIQTSNVSWAIQQIKDLKANERLVSAGNLADKVETFDPEILSKDPSLVDLFKIVKDRRDMTVDTLFDFSEDTNAGWTFAQKLFGVTTHYKPGEGGTIWIKVGGFCQDVDITDTFAVVREADLYHKWAPFCNKSLLLKFLNRIEIIMYLNISAQLLQRDAVIHAFGIDCSYEYGCVVLIGESVDAYEGVEIPPVRGWNSDRMIINGFRAKIEATTRQSGQVTLIANIDPKTPLPQTLINFATRKLAGMILYFLLKEADKIRKDPEKNVYAIRLREDPTGFYQWFHPRMEEFFTLMEAGALPDRLPLEKTQVTKSSPRRRNPSVSVLPNIPEVEIQPSRPRSDYIYDFILWPYVIMSINSSPESSILVHGVVKLVVSCLTWYYGITGAWTWEQRQNPSQALQQFRFKGLILMQILCVFNTFLVWFFSKLLAKYHEASDIESFQHFWLFASSFTLATAMVFNMFVKRW